MRQAAFNWRTQSSVEVSFWLEERANLTTSASGLTANKKWLTPLPTACTRVGQGVEQHLGYTALEVKQPNRIRKRKDHFATQKLLADLSIQKYYKIHTSLSHTSSHTSCTANLSRCGIALQATHQTSGRSFFLGANIGIRSQGYDIMWYDMILVWWMTGWERNGLAMDGSWIPQRTETTGAEATWLACSNRATTCCAPLRSRPDQWEVQLRWKRGRTKYTKEVTPTPAGGHGCHISYLGGCNETCIAWEALSCHQGTYVLLWSIPTTENIENAVSKWTWWIQALDRANSKRWKETHTHNLTWNLDQWPFPMDT